MRKTQALCCGLILTLAGCTPDSQSDTAGRESDAKAGPSSADVVTDSAVAPTARPGPAEGDATAVVSDDGVDLEDLEASLAQLAKTIQSYSEEERDQALEAATEQLRNIDTQLDRMALEAEIHSRRLAAALTEQSAEMIETLQTRRMQVAEWTARFGSDSKDAWDKVQAGFGRALQELSQAIEEAGQAFQEPGDEHAGQVP